MNKRADRCGINMKRFCREHEKRLERALAEEGPTRALLDRHLEKLRWVQHERLVHLIVLVMTVLAELFTVDLTLLHPETNPTAALVMLGLAGLLGFYFYHYFFLENTVQHWYRLTEELREGLKAREAQPRSETKGKDDDA